ncbi:ATP-binding protein [Micromonospora sp. NPDC005203]|uniref:ATP-binding protein n=1 Tax=Micromonospora sp. NPDC005203 TaxID=3364226 RepID=UPI003685EA36
MTGEMTVWAQADVLSVRTTLVPAGQSGSLETVLLRAIRAAADEPDQPGDFHADDICDVFGLAPRLVEDMLGDLWRSGRISIDLGTDREVIRLTSAGREYLDSVANGAEEGSTAARASAEQVAHDRLTGRVLPLHTTYPYPQDRALVVPTMVDDPRSATLREAELAEAVTRTLARRTRAGGTAAGEIVDNMRIDAAYLAPALLEPSRVRRYVPLRVLAVEDVTGELTVRVVDDSLPLRLREVVTRRLEGLIAERPSARFVHQLRLHAQRAPLQDRDLGQLLTQFRKAVDGLPDCPPANRQRTHDRTARLAHDILAYVRAVALTEMDVEVITTATQHREAIAGMLRRAEKQVVIAVPWVRQAGVESVRDDLIRAVGRGIQVTVLWGIGVAADPLDPTVLAMFDEIQEHGRRSGRGGTLRFNRERGARTHAKVLVRDDRELLLTSKNFLSGSDRIEAGTVLRVPTDHGEDLPMAGPVIEDVLQFLYNHTPDPATAFQLMRTRGAFGPRRDEALLPEIPLPRLTAAVLDPEAAPEHAAAWAAAWQDAALALAAQATVRRPAVEVITDGQHASLVREALEGADRRVLVTSDRATAQALTEEVGALVQARATAGLDIALRYAELKDEASGERAKALSDRGGAVPPDVGLMPRMHAKVVVRDDSTVIGSFNHLSVNAGARGRRATGELSVRIKSADVADAVWQLLLSRPTRATQRPVIPGQRGAAATTTSPQVLLGLMRSTGEPDVEALVALVAVHGPEDVLGVARRLDLGAGAERRIRAAAMLQDPSGDRPAALLTAVWQAGAWAAANVLRRAVADPAVRPSAALTAAVADPGDRLTIVLDAVTGDRTSTPEEAEALAVSTAVGLLLDELEAPDFVSLLSDWDRAAADTDDFVAAAVGYWTRYGPLPVELPSEAMAASAAADLDRLRAALATAVESLRRYDTHSDSGDAVRDHLFEAGAEMAELLAALTSGNAADLRAWEDAYRETNDSRWLIKATKAAKQPPITDHRKGTFINKHRTIRLAVRELNVAAAEEERARDGHVVLTAEQATRIRALDALVAAAPAENGVPERVVVRREMARVRSRIARHIGGDRPAPGASLASWALPLTRVAALTSDPAADRVTVLCRDLAAGWTEAQAVRHLLDAGEFGLAAESIGQIIAEGRLSGAAADTLGRELTVARAAAADLLAARAQALSSRCERVGLDDADDRSAHAVTVGERLAESLARWDRIDGDLVAEIEQLRQLLHQQLDQARDRIGPDWAQHIEGLIRDEELAVARLALSQRNSSLLLPQPVRLTPWSWRVQSLTTVAGWFGPTDAGAPPQMAREFLPAEGDAEAAEVITALRALAADLPGAAGTWVTAVQALVAEIDDVPVVDEYGAGASATFRLPYDVRLPRLRWMGRPPAVATVGAVPERGKLHFSAGLADYSTDTAVISVADVLSLLGRDPAGRPATRTTRALLFLGTVCGQLPLSEVIAPRDIPAEHTLDSRKMLAWLLHILGFTYTATDLDSLRVLGGGHQVPLWHLIDAARTDPIAGVGRLRDRPDRDAILRAGLATDLDDEVDLLVLSTMLSMNVTDRAGLRSALELVWEAGTGLPDVPSGVAADAAVDRLIGKGYVIESSGMLSSCACAVVRAQHRQADLDGELSRLVRHVHARVEVDDLMYHELLAFYAAHADQAEAALRSPEEQRESARRTLNERMSDRAPFDLRPVCAAEARRAEMIRGTVDVYWESPTGAPVWVAGPEMPYGYLVRELLTNAISAVAKDAAEGSVWLSLEREGEGDAATATLIVSDSGPGFPDDFVAAFRQNRPLGRPDEPARGNGFHKLRRYAEANGASYEIASGTEGGAVVKVRLPVLTGPDPKNAT